ncbi:hypothetical protein NFI96_017999 [Prochilodus magdalenae]|nr:hypothetical protein NFI96_017999 [Prochilodus magdalenae]
MSTHHDEKTLSQYVDFISLLPASLDEPQIDSAVNYWQEQGVEPKKLTMVLPAFLRRSRRREHGRHSETADLNPEKLEQPYGPVLMIAKQVCQAIKSGQTKLKTLTTFESAQSLREEVSWLLQKGFGGVGVVMLDTDNFVNSICLNCTEIITVMVPTLGVAIIVVAIIIMTEMVEQLTALWNPGRMTKCQMLMVMILFIVMDTAAMVTVAMDIVAMTTLTMVVVPMIVVTMVMVTMVMLHTETIFIMTIIPQLRVKQRKVCPGMLWPEPLY